MCDPPWQTRNTLLSTALTLTRRLRGQRVRDEHCRAVGCSEARAPVQFHGTADRIAVAQHELLQAFAQAQQVQEEARSTGSTSQLPGFGMAEMVGQREGPAGSIEAAPPLDE